MADCGGPGYGARDHRRVAARGQVRKAPRRRAAVGRDDHRDGPAAAAAGAITSIVVALPPVTVPATPPKVTEFGLVIGARDDDRLGVV